MNINATLLGQMIAFAMFVWFCMKYVWPPLIKAIEDRQAKIADGLAAAERGKQDLSNAKEESDKLIAAARNEAAEIVNKANKRASLIIEDSKDGARAEAEKIMVANQAEIEQEVARAKESLRLELADLVIAGTSKVLERAVEKKDHEAALDKLIADL